MRKFFDKWEAISIKYKFNMIFPIVALIFFISSIVMGYMLIVDRSQPNILEEYIAAGVLLDIDEPPSEEEPEPRIFISLGDSVASGFGSLPEQRYTAILYERLKTQDLVDKYINKGIISITTTDLLEFLHSLDDDDLNSIRNAEIITLNIGGNNVLVPFLEHLPDPENIMDIISESWDFIFESLDTVLDFVDVALEGWEVVDNWRLWQIWRIPALNRVRRDVSATLDDVMEVVNRAMELEMVNLLPLLQGDFPPGLESALQNGIEIFAAEFNETIKWLEINAPEAIIIVNTVYNPIPQQFLGTSLEISNKANTLVQAINNIILGNSESRGYLVADVYTEFENESNNMINIYLDTSAMILSFDIIHPNIAGHKLIAELNYVSFMQHILAEEIYYSR